MADIFYQIRNVPEKLGTIVVKPPKASGWFEDNTKIDSYPVAYTAPDTGILNAAYSGRFREYNFYAGGFGE